MEENNTPLSPVPDVDNQVATPPIAPTPPTPEPIQPPTQPIPAPQRWLVILSVIILAVAIILVAFKLILKNKTTTPPEPTPTTLSQPTPSPTPDPTAGWKTFTSRSLGYSIKYPEGQNLKLLDCKSSNVGTKNYDFILAKDTSGCEGQGEGFIITTQEVANPTSCQDTESWKTKKTDLMISDAPATKCEYTFIGQALMGPAKNFTQISIPSKNILITLSDENYQTLFDQILSTFRFIGPSEASAEEDKFIDQSTAEGKFCGGIAANLPENQCPEGFSCKLDGKYPDAGGVCTKN